MGGGVVQMCVGGVDCCLRVDRLFVRCDMYAVGEICLCFVGRGP